MAIFVGTEIRLKAEWHKPINPDDVPSETDPLADPSAVTLEILKNDETLVNWTYGVGTNIVKDAVGKYHALYSPDSAGIHKYIWRGTGAAAQVKSGNFYVEEL
jgi:hypothetical protein